jgi:hypothetical protein
MSTVLQLGTLTEGTFEPGMTVGGRVVRKWHTQDTVPHYLGGKTYYRIRIEFTTGEVGDATKVSR